MRNYLRRTFNKDELTYFGRIGDKTSQAIYRDIRVKIMAELNYRVTVSDHGPLLMSAQAPHDQRCYLYLRGLDQRLKMARLWRDGVILRSVT